MNSLPHDLDQKFVTYKKRYYVVSEDIDGFGHMNNTVYLRLMEELAWTHSDVLGLGLVDFQRLGFGMVARQHIMTYFAPLLLNEEVELQTWLEPRDALSLHRYYRFTRVSDDKVAFEGHTHWVCVALATGRPQRMPQEFRATYGVK